mmetsp:Transcript_112998/g.326509  ORF Transcript_112998/g.326509 Transcript_112998/m.326509 type:complete len:243 (-) Transcript_112998:660-1388(-)
MLHLAVQQRRACRQSLRAVPRQREHARPWRNARRRSGNGPSFWKARGHRRSTGADDRLAEHGGHGALTAGLWALGERLQDRPGHVRVLPQHLCLLLQGCAEEIQGDLLVLALRRPARLRCDTRSGRREKHRPPRRLRGRRRRHGRLRAHAAAEAATCRSAHLRAEAWTPHGHATCRHPAALLRHRPHHHRRRGHGAARHAAARRAATRRAAEPGRRSHVRPHGPAAHGRHRWAHRLAGHRRA